jgi:hypothetical protein
MHHDSPQLMACVRSCLECYTHCQHTALSVCLEKGGEHLAPDHFRLMISCAEACRAAAALLVSHSPHHAESCRLCAKICRECADSCERIGDMDECVKACRDCAESCETMAASG